jgi:hypothetical protein
MCIQLFRMLENVSQLQVSFTFKTVKFSLNRCSSTKLSSATNKEFTSK